MSSSSPAPPLGYTELAKQQRPDLPWLADALAVCTAAHKKLKGRKKKCIYVYFVDPANANQPGAEWKYAESISLDHPIYGHIQLDCISDNRIGGIEFYDRLFSSGKPKP